MRKVFNKAISFCIAVIMCFLPSQAQHASAKFGDEKSYHSTFMNSDQTVTITSNKKLRMFGLCTTTLRVYLCDANGTGNDRLLVSRSDFGTVIGGKKKYKVEITVESDKSKQTKTGYFKSTSIHTPGASWKDIP